MSILKIFSFSLLAITTIVLMAATIMEKLYGTEFVGTNVYGAWWFIGLWAGLCLTSIAYILRRRLHRPATLLLHLAFVVILTGALVTHVFGIQGSMHVRKGEVVNAFVNRENNMIELLPFAVELKDFQLRTYPGTQSAMDYVSLLSISEYPSGKESKDIWDDGKAYGDEGEADGDKSNADEDASEGMGNGPSSLVKHLLPVEQMSVSMNNIGTYRSYRFYQSGYDPDYNGTYLSVSYDPWGIGITYTGYALLLIAMILMMGLPHEGFRRVLKQSRVASSAIVLMLFSFSSSTLNASTPKTLPKDVAADFANLYTYYNGRICPLQTVAIDFTTKLYGKSTYQGYTAEQVFTGMMLFPTTWLDQPIIKIKGDVGRLLDSPDKSFVCYDDFFQNGEYRLAGKLQAIHSGKNMADSRAITEADEKMNILRMLFSGQLLKIYPALMSADNTENGNTDNAPHSVTWYSQGDNLPTDMPHDQWFFIKHSMDYIGELAVSGKYEELRQTVGKIREYQVKTVGANSLPSDAEFNSELMYNRLNHTRPLAMALTTVGIIVFIIYLVLSARGRTMNRWFRTTLLTVTIMTATYIAVLITLRTIASGHIPLANGYETMVFMSLCSLLLTLCLWKRNGLMPSFGFIMSGLTLMVAMMGQSNPQITPLMPVLSSPLLSIHVCVIMIAYTLLAFITLTSIAALVSPSQSGWLTRQSQLLLYPALFLLTAGIFIGAVWANVSWGRYWGWDPKEVWALITMIVYAVPMHRESLPAMRSPKVFNIYLIAAFLSVIITYFGVNFFLGGMHSYAAN